MASGVISNEKIVNLAGFGLIGQERARSVLSLENNGFRVKIGKVFDPFASDVGVSGRTFERVRSFSDLVKSPCDLLVIACPHDTSPGYAIEALGRGQTVLLEKPMGRNHSEAKRIADAIQTPEQLFLGFNYRFMAGIKELLKDIEANTFGPLVSVTIQMGHGGKPEDRASWKLSPEKCGGGALLDPGIHLLDILSCIFGENLTPLSAAVWNGFWKTGIEEEAHVLFKADKAICNLQVSIVRWSSTFLVQVWGTDGYGIVSGRGKSYGSQTYRRGTRWGWLNQKKPQRETEEFVVETDCDDSFTQEIASCLGFGSAYSRKTDLSHSLAVMNLLDQTRSLLI